MKKRMPDKPRDSDKETTFDLREERWIPVVREDGTPMELSLREVLRDTPQLREIRDPLPTVEFGLYRLLVTLVLDIFELKSADDLESLLKTGEFDEVRMDEYFEEWHDRFDLFHPVRPFLQTQGMKDEKSKPLAGLLHPIPAGTNANHFHHGNERSFGVSPACAARLLTTIAPFMTAGGAGLSPSINGAPPWYAMVKGRTLFETLCLNCPVLSDLLPQAQGEAPPAWRSNIPVSAQRRSGASLLEALTWQPRRIQLVADGSGRCSLTGREMLMLVKEMKFSAGFGAGFEWTDPQVAFRIGKEGSSVLRPQEGRAAWRDTGPIALLRADEYQSENGKMRFERPAIVSQFAFLHQHKMVDKSLPLNLVIYGIRSDLKMKVFEWHRVELSLPTPLLWKTQFQRDAQQEMDQADKVAYALRQAIKKCYPREGVGNKAAFNSLIARALNDFWTALRLNFETLLHELVALTEEDAADRVECITRWRKVIRIVAETALHAAIDDLDNDADALERRTAALRFFDTKLFFMLNPGSTTNVRRTKNNRTKKEDIQ
jgi:CRISPR system Cascade subunit CasA